MNAEHNFGRSRFGWAYSPLHTLWRRRRRRRNEEDEAEEKEEAEEVEQRDELIKVEITSKVDIKLGLA
jgi:hypothetical protein